MSAVVLVEVDAGVATVTMNRPEARNALSAEVRDGLAAAFATTERRADVAVVILTGADPAFCAGLDLKELGSAGADTAAVHARSTDDVTGRRGLWERLGKPLQARNRSRSS